MSNPDKITHFGFQTVGWDEKAHKVNAVFDSVASRYDLMNDLMSLGIHRAWKQLTVMLSQIRPGQCVLDLAGGSGDLTRLIHPKLKASGCIVLADINANMLAVARNRLLDAGIHQHLHFIQANAEHLPFANNTFDCLFISFGLRNVRDKEAALQSMYRCAKPGGRLLILEFSSPVFPGLKPIYDAYSFHILPQLGEWIANDAESYRYLAESIRMHPHQNELKLMIEEAGFEDCHYHNLSGGIVALHTAYKY
jgi:demethylmenaquinone methyltransferase/2-methoxy-6-polyprenyl-1,4-benzoquinol methylase